jgi:hypothetical protein
LDGALLPNLEDPKSLIGSWKDRPIPACFAPICGHWEPRKAWAGTYDEAWQQTRAPYLPTDFDARFAQVAPPGQVVAGYLAPGTEIEVRGATPDGTLRCSIPPLRAQVAYLVDQTPQMQPANLDTLLIEPDAGRMVLVWRSSLRCDKTALRINEVRPVVQKAA